MWLIFNAGQYFQKLFSRRFFLISSALNAFLFFTGESAAASEKRGVLRPPGSLPEKEFLARCTKCQKCLQVCHMRVITPLPLSAGFPAAGTPAVSYRNGYCDLCMKCVDVCPYGAIRHIGKEETSIGVAVIVKKYCIAWDWVGCVACVDRCPLKAIELDEVKRPFIIKEKCNGCGECEVVCPALSLRSSKGAGKGVIVVPWGDEGGYEE